MYEWVENHTDELETKDVRQRASFHAARAAWRIDPERGMRLVKLLDPESSALWNLYNKWAEQDPRAASARLLLEPDVKIRERATGGLIYAWALKDPAAAKAWAESIPDPIQSAKAVVNVGSVIGGQDPRAGADFLARIPQTNDARESLKQTVSKWAERDMSAALGWAAGLEDAGLGDWVATEVITKMPAKKQEKAQQHWSDLREPKPAEKDR
jgi:hypothetical protein